MKLAGLDIGTTSVGGVLIDADSGAIVDSAVVEHDAGLSTARTWEKLQDPVVLLAAAKTVLERFTTAHPDIQGLGLTGQMHGIVYLDQNGQALGPLITWQDQRGALAWRDGKTYVQTLSELTGHSLSTGYGLVTHYFNLQNALVPDQAVSLCTINDYIAMQLSGAIAPTLEPTQAAGLGLFDLRAGRFDTEALRKAGINERIVPLVAPAGTRVGQTDKGIPVFSTLGDNQAGFLGSVQDPTEALMINIGTSGQVSVFTQQFLEVEGLEPRPFPGGGFILVGASLCGGKAYALLESFLRRVCRLFAGYDGPKLYDAMNRLVSEASRRPEDDDSLVVDTRFLGTRSDPQRRGAIQRITTDNLTPEALIRGFLDGIADELGTLYERLPAASRRRAYLVGIGNGVRHNAALARVISDRFELPLRFPVHAEEAAFGAALSAGVGLGLYRDFSDAARMVRYV